MKTDKEIIEEVWKDWKGLTKSGEVKEMIRKALNLSKANYKKQVEDLIDELPNSCFFLGKHKVIFINREQLKQKLGEIK